MSISNITRENNFQLYCAGLDVGSQKLTNVGAPEASTDGVNKEYVDTSISSNDLSSVLANGNDADYQNMTNIQNVNCHVLDAFFHVDSKYTHLHGMGINIESDIKNAIVLDKDKPMVFAVDNTTLHNAWCPGMTFYGKENVDRSLYLYTGDKSGNQWTENFNQSYSVKIGNDEMVNNNTKMIMFKSPGTSSEAQRKLAHNIIFNDGDSGLHSSKSCQISMFGDPTNGVKGNISFSVQNGTSVPPSLFSETMRINGNRVGIMTTSPESTLDVNGQILTQSIYSKGNLSCNQLSVGPMNQPTSHICAHFRSPNVVDTVGGQLYIEAGRDAGGTRSGWGTLSWNGYLNANTGYVRSDPNKQIWQMRVDQRTGTDNFNISSLNPVNPNSPITRSWLSFDGEEGAVVNDRLVVDAHASLPVVRPNNDNDVDLGYTGFRWKDIYAGNSAIITSDLNKKKEISNLSKGLEFINQLRPVQYKFKDGTSDRQHYGLIAQELETLFNNSYNDAELTSNALVIKNKSLIQDPEWVEPEDDGCGTVHSPPMIESTTDFDYALRYNELIAPLIKAVQELTVKNNELMARVEALESV